MCIDDYQFRHFSAARSKQCRRFIFITQDQIQKTFQVNISQFQQNQQIALCKILFYLSFKGLQIKNKKFYIPIYNISIQPGDYCKVPFEALLNKQMIFRVYQKDEEIPDKIYKIQENNKIDEECCYINSNSNINININSHSNNNSNNSNNNNNNNYVVDNNVINACNYEAKINNKDYFSHMINNINISIINNIKATTISEQTIQITQNLPILNTNLINHHHQNYNYNIISYDHNNINQSNANKNQYIQQCKQLNKHITEQLELNNDQNKEKGQYHNHMNSIINNINNQHNTALSSSSSLPTNQIKRIKQPQRIIYQVLLSIKKWRLLYQKKHLNLTKGAKLLGISKKSLDDYYLVIRIGQILGFNYQQNLYHKMGDLRAFIRKFDYKVTGKLHKQVKCFDLIPDVEKQTQEMLMEMDKQKNSSNQMDEEAE